MHPDLVVSRRVLVKSFRLYLDADRAWTVAAQEARSWFPAGCRPAGSLVGDPHSRIRQLYETRERALQRLLVAREKLERSRRRSMDRQRQDRAQTTILLLAH